MKVKFLFFANLHEIFELAYFVLQAVKFHYLCCEKKIKQQKYIVDESL